MSTALPLTRTPADKPTNSMGRPVPAFTLLLFWLLAILLAGVSAWIIRNGTPPGRIAIPEDLPLLWSGGGLLIFTLILNITGWTRVWPWTRVDLARFNLLPDFICRPLSVFWAFLSRKMA